MDKERTVYNILKKYAKDNGLVEYNYPDGFYVFGNPDSQEMADKKHKEWLTKQMLDAILKKGEEQ